MDWKKAEPANSAAFKAAKHPAKPPQSMQDMVAFLDKFLAHKPHQGEDLQAMAGLHSLAAGLREGIAGTEPRVSKGNKLKSVIGKLAFKKVALPSLKAKLKQAQQDLEEMENKHDTLSTEVATLEEERTELANLMANQPDSDTDGEQDVQEPEVRDHPMGAYPHWTPKAKAKPKPDEEEDDDDDDEEEPHL